jgi:hypothetical protein
MKDVLDSEFPNFPLFYPAKKHPVSIDHRDGCQDTLDQVPQAFTRTEYFQCLTSYILGQDKYDKTGQQAQYDPAKRMLYDFFHVV